VKIKIDENLAAAHKLLPAQAGHDVADVHDEGLRGASDKALWQHGCTERRFLVTLDHDFSDVRRLPPGGHPGILLVRTAHPSRNLVATVLRRVLGEVVLDTLAGCLVVADEGRTRIRKGKQGA
jgi:predicted nuclease of predicted toxin-antitoxin system